MTMPHSVTSILLLQTGSFQMFGEDFKDSFNLKCLEMHAIMGLITG